ncbi:MAG: hypothetical protein ABI823_01455 [Bryobacteraceae bacterium]
MRRLIVGLMLFALVLAAPSCKRKKKAGSAQPPDDGKLKSVLLMADPRATIQLLSGFHAVENDAWRWTQGKFAVSLKIPDGAAARPTVVEMKFTLPQVILDKLKSVTLTATVGGVPLQTESYTKAGDYTFRREVPPSVIKGEALTVEFALDKAYPPTPQDERELGLIVQSIGLQ